MAQISGWPNVSVGIALLGCTTSGTAVSAAPNSTNQIPIYTEVGQRCRSIVTNRGKQYELDIARGQLNKFTFDNRDGLLDPNNTGSLYYPQVSTHKQIRFQTVQSANKNLLEPNIATGGDTYGAGAIFQIIQQNGTTLNTVASVAPTVPLQGSIMYSSTYTNGTASGTHGWAFGNGTLTPGTQYTFSVYANIPTTSLSFKVTADCYNAAGTLLSSTTGTPVTVTNSWGRLSVTFTPPANTIATVFYIQSNAVAASTFSLCTDQFQLEAGSSATTWTAPGTTNILCTNYIQSLHTFYDQLTRMQLLELTTQDALGVLSQQLLLNVHGNEIQQLTPYGYWPLGDSSKAISAGSIMNAAGVQQPPAPLHGFGNGSSPSFGGSSIVAGDPNGTCLTFDNTAVAGASWTQLDIPVLINSATTGAVSVSFWFQTSQVPATEADILAQTTINAWSDFSIAILNNGHLTFNVLYNSSTSYDTIDSGKALNDGKPHFVTAIIYSSNTRMQLWVDNVQLGDIARTTTRATGQAVVFTRLGNGGFNQLPYVGSVQHFAIYNTALTNQQITNLWQSGKTGWSGDNTTTRFSRILGYSGCNIQGAYPFNGGVQTEMGLLDCAGQSVLDALNLVIQDEQGNLYNRGDGFVGFEQRHDRWRQLTPAWTIGDGAGEIPYLGTVDTELDDVKVVNYVQASRYNGAVQSATDLTSVNNHFYRAYPTTLTLKTATDADVATIVQGIVWRYKNPMERLSAAEFDPASSSGSTVWSFVTGSDIGQRIRYNRRPRGAAVRSLDVWLESIGFSITFTEQGINWTMSIEASPGLPGNPTPGLSGQQFILTAARTTLKTSTIVGATSFTLNALPDAATNTSQSDGWTASAIQNITIWDGANTETLAVSSIATTSVGYTQFVITTSNAAQFAHTAGVVVAEYLPQGAFTSWTYNTFDTAAALDGNNILGY